MDIVYEFNPCDRYVFDFDLCQSKDGWAQVDTTQDACYFGTWANPFKLEIISYTEGDICIKKASNIHEFISELKDIIIWNELQGYWKGIDTLCREEITTKFVEFGLSNYLYRYD